MPFIFLLIEIRFEFNILGFIIIENNFIKKYIFLISLVIVVFLIYLLFWFFLKYRIKYYLFFVTVNIMNIYWSAVLTEGLFFGLLKYNKSNEDDGLEIVLLTLILSPISMFILGILADRRIKKIESSK